MATKKQRRTSGSIPVEVREKSCQKLIGKAIFAWDNLNEDECVDVLDSLVEHFEKNPKKHKRLRQAAMLINEFNERKK